MNVLDLFSGIGGFSLGLERAGMRTVAFCEIDPFCRRVLSIHWPGVPCYDDIRTLTAERLAADGIVVDAICGGFPCQDISSAGKGAGIEGSRSAYGRSTPELLASYDPATSSWRTSQRCLVEGWTLFSETWPRSGTMRNGIAYQLPPLAPLTDETASGLWPTPMVPNGGRSVAHVNDWRGRTAYHNGKKVQVDLAQAVKRWPTPHGFSQDGRSNGPSGNELGRAVNRSMVPTPKLPSGGGQMTRTTPGGGIRKLEDWVSADLGQNTGSLNPPWVEWLMGFPLGWTDCGASATPSSRKSQKSSGARS
jgi:hypothetical protein